MPVTPYWHTPDETVIRVEFAGRWLWSEVYTALDQIEQWIEARTTQRYALIAMDVDEQAGADIPTDALSNLRTISSRLPVPIVRVCVVDHGPMLLAWRALDSALRRFHVPYQQRFVFVASLDEAERQVQKALSEEPPL